MQSSSDTRIIVSCYHDQRVCFSLFFFDWFSSCDPVVVFFLSGFWLEWPFFAFLRNVLVLIETLKI